MAGCKSSICAKGGLSLRLRWVLITKARQLIGQLASFVADRESSRRLATEIEVLRGFGSILPNRPSSSIGRAPDL